MVPIYFHYMSVSTYGAWLATGNVVAMLGLLESGFSSVITQKMSRALGKNDMTCYAKLAGANIITAVAIALTMALIGLCIAPFVADWINVAPHDSFDIKRAYIIALIASCIAICVSLFNAFPQVWQDTKFAGMISTCTGLLAIVSLVSFLVAGMGVVSIAMSYLVRALANLVFQGLWIIRKWKRENIQPPVFSFSESRLLAKDCVFPFLSKLSNVIMGHSQSFIIAHFISPTISAVYDLTAKVCSVACGFVSQTNGSFFALFSLTLSSDDKEKMNRVFKNTTCFFMITLSMVGLYSLCFTEPIIYYWVGADKFGGLQLLFLIVISSLFFQLRSYCNNIMYTGGMINKSARLDILCAFVYIASLSILIKSTRIYAVPLASLIASLLFVVWYIKLIKRCFSLNVKILYTEFEHTMLIVIPFFGLNCFCAPDYTDLTCFIPYSIAFFITHMVVLYLTNKTFFTSLLSRICYKKKF